VPESKAKNLAYFTKAKAKIKIKDTGFMVKAKTKSLCFSNVKAKAKDTVSQGLFTDFFSIIHQ